MKNDVYYLVLSDKPQKAGLIFPSETDNNDFRIGQWFIRIGDGDWELKESYNFDCVTNGILTTYSLIRKRNNIYQLTTKDKSVYFFRIEPRRYWSNRYVGRSTLFSSGDILYVVVPISTEALSTAAKEKRFYFVGRVDQQIERKS